MLSTNKVASWSGENKVKTAVDDQICSCICLSKVSNGRVRHFLEEGFKEE
jgi:hypothetical protein